MTTRSTVPQILPLGSVSSELAAPTGHLKVAEHNGLLSISAGVVGLLSYGCNLLMANALDSGRYSQFAAGQMMLGIVGIVASALVPLPLSHAVAMHSTGSEPRRDGIAFAAQVSLLAGILAALVAGGVTLAFAPPTMAAAVAVAALALFLVAAPSGWLQGELRFMRYALTSIGEVVLRLLFSILAIILIWGPDGAILGFVIGALALLAVPFSFYRDLTWRPHVLRQKWRWVETGDIALTLCVVSVLVGADVVVIAFLDGGSDASSGFQALATIAKGPVYVAAGTVLVAFPLLRTPGAQLNNVLSASLRSFGQLALVAFAVIATVPRGLASLILPERYHVALSLLPWLAVSGLSYATLTVLATVLLALRAYRRCQLGLGVACILVPGGLFAGWQLNGVDGLAIGCALGSMLAAAVLAAISYPLLPPGTATDTVRGIAAAVALIVLLSLVSLQPALWLLVVLGIGLAVLARQRGRRPVNSKWIRRFRRLMVLRASGSADVKAMLRKFWFSGSRDDTQIQPDPTAVATEKSSKHRVSGRVLPITAHSARTLAAFVLISGMALGIRCVGLLQGFELWVDEMLYAKLGQSVSAGQLPNLPDGPFFLHPPGFFLVEGGIINLFGISGGIVDVVLDLRWLNAVIGSTSVGLAFLVVRRVANKPAAWVAAVVLSFEPFVLRNNSHVFLETLGMAAVLGGLMLLVAQLKRRANKLAVPQLVLAGLLLGYSVLTKDVFALCTIVPTIVGTFWRRTLRIRDAVIVVAATAAPYILYLTVIAIQGQFPEWVWAKTNGVQRLIGVEKSTGFTAAGSPDFLTRLVDQAGHFGSSYLLLALCPIAACLVCFSHRADRRMIGLVSLAWGAFGLYSAVFGTFEEQYGYGVVLAGVLSGTVLAAEIVERRPRFRWTIISGAIVLIGLAMVLGIRTEFTADNGYVQVRNWIQGNLPADARVSVTNSTGQFMFAEDPRFGVWPSAPLMEQSGATYILTQSLPTSQGYGYAQPAMISWLSAKGVPLIIVQGPTNGSTTLWRVSEADLAEAAAAGVGTPTRTYATER
ncbi:hypothetical protein ACSVHC_15760 [Arthrobacter sp. KNU-44]|uniref:hypothetical protein n=1 Tax=unclassified Arthrobacter TaxID=235627 RepID=UPI003F43B3F6